MDQKLLRSHHKESMKLALLTHENIFRQQVYELHRLYRVQRLLMNNMEAAIRSTAEMQQVIDESEIELTLGPSKYSTSKVRSKGVATSDGFKWNCDGSGENGMRMNPGEDRLGKHPPWLFQRLNLNFT